jgi:hypothetical protein
LTAKCAVPDQTLACEGDVYARDGSATGRCRTCGTQYQRAERQDWIDTLRRDWLYHASEITEAYPEIKANTVSKWYSRGLLASHGEHNGGPLFKVGEVLDLAAGDKARREEIRAERDRRRKTADPHAAGRGRAGGARCNLRWRAVAHGRILDRGAELAGERTQS